MRILVAIPVLVAAIFGEYRLRMIPLPTELGKPIVPVEAALVSQELVVDNPFREIVKPASGIRTELLPPNDTTKGISLSAHFASARLSDNIMKRLQGKKDANAEKKPPTAGLQQIDYTTDAPDEEPQGRPGSGSVATTQPCGAAISIALLDDTRPPKEIHFLQPADRSVEDRALEVRAVGADLIVQLTILDPSQPVIPGPARKSLGPGCSKIVSVGEWECPFTGPTQLEVIVPDGESFQIWFSPLAKQNPWPTANDFYEPFQLVALPPVTVSGLSLISKDPSPSMLPILKASRVAGEPPLLLTHLRVGAEKLQLDVSGKAMVQKEGKDIETFDLWKWMKLNPLIAILLSGLEVGLVNWVRLSFKKTPNGPGARRKKRGSRRETKH